MELSHYRNSSLSTVVIDREGIICAADFKGQAFGDALGWPADDLVGRPFLAIHEAHQIATRDISRGVKLVCTGKETRFRYRFDLHVDQHELCYELIADSSVGSAEKIVVTYENIIDRKEQTRALINNTNLYEFLLQQAAIGILYQNNKAIIELANTEAERLLGASQSELRNLRTMGLPCEVFDEEGEPVLFENLPGVHAVLTGEAHYDVVLKLVHATGKVFWISCSSQAIFDTKKGERQGVLSTFVDITHDRKVKEALKEQTERAQMAVESAEMGVWEWITNEKKMVWDRKLFQIYGYDPDEVKIDPIEVWKKSMHPDDLQRALKVTADLIEGRRKSHFDYRILWPDGRLRHLRAQARQIFNAKGEVTRVIGVTHDVTHAVMAEKKLWELAYTDTLTGAYSRAGLNVRLSETLARGLSSNSPFYVVNFSLRRFKEINENYGLAAGDKVLCEVARRVNSIIDATDTVARVGGDEYTVVIESLEEHEDIGSFILLLRQEVLQPFHLNDGLVLFLDAAVGFSCFPEDATDPATLQTNAGLAMRNDRLREHSDYTAYAKEMSDLVSRKFNLKYQLFNAVKDNEFQLYYQPIIDLENRAVVGCEALIRWRDNMGNFVSPMEFIPIVEESGLIYELGKWINLTAVKQWKLWQQLVPNLQYISVNVSPRQLEQPEFVAELVSMVREYDVCPENLQLEITEGTFLREYNNEDGMLHKLAFHGFRLAIDDFGTGYSSLAYLKRFNVDVIKIDRSFIQDLERDSSDLDIVSAIVAMNTKLGFKTLVEGVETEDQHQIVSELGCESAQGYLYGKPTFADEFAEIYIQEKI